MSHTIEPTSANITTITPLELQLSALINATDILDGITLTVQLYWFTSREIAMTKPELEGKMVWHILCNEIQQYNCYCL